MADRRAEAFAGIATLLAALAAVIVFFPAEGHVLVPLRAALDGLFGQTTFVLPLGLTLAASLGFVRRTWPDARLPRRQLIGLGVITIAVVLADALLGQSTGVVGEWFTGFLIALVGAPLTVALTLMLLALGSILVFDLTAWRRRAAG